MSICWLKPYLGTSPAFNESHSDNIRVIDVRMLVDKAGNSPEVIRQKIEEGVASIKEGRQIVVCCDYGISRSNAIAAGIISVFEKISFDDAICEVIEETGMQEIKLSVADAVRTALCLNANHSQISSALRLLVTGGSGFVGKALIPMLPEEYLVFAPGRAEIDLISGAGRLDLFVKRNAISHIIHLANPKVFVSNKAMGETLTMLRNVLDVCVLNKVFLFYTSNWEVYSGYQSAAFIANESTPLNPKGPYGETKWLCESLIDHYRKKFGVQCCLLRSSSLYGVSSDRPKFIWTFLEKARKNDFIQTHQFKNGYPHLDLLQVNDFCRAIVQSLKRNYFEDINLGTGRLLSTWDIAHNVCSKLHSCSQIEAVDIEDYAPNVAMGISKAKELLNWIPSITFEDGLDDLIEEMKRREVIKGEG